MKDKNKTRENRRRRLLALVCLFLMAAACAVAQDNKVAQDIFANLRQTDKAAVVAVHFGTSSPETRAKTIEKFNQRLRAAFPDCDFREAWTSRVIIKKLASQGEQISTPEEVFAELARQGYTHVLVQSSNVINGTELECLRSDIDAVKDKFAQVRLGEPLLSTVKDYEDVALAVAASYGKEKNANVLVCHGTWANYNPAYTMLDYVLRDKGYDNWYVGTIEGYPSFESMAKQLKKDKAKRVNLIPCLFVAGNHVANDIAGDWKDKLKSLGYKVDVCMHSIGEVDGILDIYVKHAKEAQKYRTLTPVEAKIVSAVK